MKGTALSSVCGDCLSFKIELAAAKAKLKRFEKAKSSSCPSEECNAWAAQAVLLSDLREEKENSDSENFYFRQILSWVLARKP